MNMLERIIPSSTVTYSKSYGKMNIEWLMNDSSITSAEGYEPIVKLYDYYNTHKSFIYGDEESENNYQELYVYQDIRDKIFELPYDRTVIVDVLVRYLYCERKTPLKKTLWWSFGDYLVDNLKRNLPKGTRVCPICGERFTPPIHAEQQVYCSEKCWIANKHV